MVALAKISRSDVLQSMHSPHLNKSVCHGCFPFCILQVIDKVNRSLGLSITLVQDGMVAAVLTLLALLFLLSVLQVCCSL